jgi:UDP-N-acetylglucosamine 3-dehydrogenase
MSVPKIVLIGVGKFGKNHFRVLQELDASGECELYGVIDVNEGLLKNITQNTSIKTSTKMNLIDDNVDGVIIVTPTNTHYNLSKKVLQMGKHCFVEKPLVTEYKQAVLLSKIAEKNNVYLMVGHIFRYNMAVRKIREIIENDDLGEIYYITGNFKGIKDPRTDVGSLHNFTVHHIDIYNYILNRTPQNVYAIIKNYLKRDGLEDLALVFMEYEKNILATIEGSWLPPGKHRDIQIIGEKKSLSADLLTQTITIHETYISENAGYLQGIDKGSHNLVFDFTEPLKLEIKDFINCIKTGTKPLADVDSALNVTLVAEHALRSAKEGKAIKIE